VLAEGDVLALLGENGAGKTMSWPLSPP
jgi:ABC-type multidrug transport system ATPase subunit